MPPATGTRRAPPVLLINRLLNPPTALKDVSPSPFTLILDSLCQSAAPLVAEYVRRAATGKAQVNAVYVAFETVRPPAGVSTTIRTFRKSIQTIQQEVLSALKPQKRNLIVLDSLHPLCLPSLPASTLSTFLSSLLQPTTSIVATYHQDYPSHDSSIPGYPPPLRLLRYLATAILTIRSLPHLLAQKKRADRALPPKRFAWWEEGEGEVEEGLVVPLGSNDPSQFVVDIEARRKSGRGVEGLVVMRKKGEEWVAEAVETVEGWKAEVNMKMDIAVDEEGFATTFDLGLTEEQKKKRDEVELPYFDAQKEGGGKGGMIVYVPEKVDDWDEEEDEI